MTQLSDYEITIDWLPSLRVYGVDVVLDTGREMLVFKTLKEATDYRLGYLADIELLLKGEKAIYGSGAVL